MSSQNKNKNQQGSHILSTIAAVGIGAIAAAGAYFVGKAIGEEEALDHYESRVKQERLRDFKELQKVQTKLSPSSSKDDKLEKEEKLEIECSICMRDFEEVKENGDEIHTTPCGHIFCANCITKCIRTKHECPKCKKVVKPGQTLRIFL